LLFAVTLLAVILAAHLSFRYFESPILRLKRRFESNDQRRGDELSRITAEPSETRTTHVADEVRATTPEPAPSQT
jgi:peptidoglycan/LPS O-acetylase OafA/YrhL